MMKAAIFGIVVGVGISISYNAKGSQNQIECLAKNMYFEARGQGTAGVLAVAFGVLNRVNDHRFPNTICEVVYQAITRPSWKDKSKRYPIRNRCQFSWYCDGKSDEIHDWRSYHAITEVARMVLLGYIEDNTNGSTFYHANYVKPHWSNHMAVAVIHDKHIFYRMR